MPLYRDEAIVLRTHKLGEADRIITMLTRTRGRVRAVAKGVRRTKSRFGSRLEPGMVVDVQCYEGRNLDTVTQAETPGALRRRDRPRLHRLHRRDRRCSRRRCGSPRSTSRRPSSTSCSPARCARSPARARPGPRPRRLPAALARRRRLGAELPRLREVRGARAAPRVQHPGRRRRLPRMPPARARARRRRRRSAARGAAHRRLGRRRRVRRAAPARGQRARHRLPPVAHRARAALARVIVETQPEPQANPIPTDRRPSTPSRSRTRAVRRPPRSRPTSCRSTSRSSWTATAGGPTRAGCPRTKGHEAGEASLLDVVAGAIEVGVTHLSAYAFSTENWRRSPDEVRFLMGFNRDVIRRRRDQLHEWGVRMRWVGRTPRLWRSVIKELEVAQELTQHNTGLTLYFCVNYGGRAEIADAVQRIAEDVGRSAAPGSVDEKTIDRYLDEPTCPTSTSSCGQLGRAADEQLPAVAVRLRRDGLPEPALAGLRPARPVGRDRELRRPRPPLRRSGRHADHGLTPRADRGTPEGIRPRSDPSSLSGRRR